MKQAFLQFKYALKIVLGSKQKWRKIATRTQWSFLSQFRSEIEGKNRKLQNPLSL
jgi:hypothetical protein